MADLNQDALDYAVRWVDYRQCTNDVPGMVLGIRSGDDLVVEQAYGLADIEHGVAMTADHRFRVASHSKMYASTAVMQLVEQGRLRLDDRVSDHLGVAADRPVGAVTIRHLLNHAGGVFRDGSDIRFWDLSKPFPTGPEIIDDASAADLVYEPSVRFKYSNVGYALVGLVIEAVTGRPYSEHVEQTVLAPIDAKTTTVDLTPEAEEHLATGYTHALNGMPRFAVPNAHTGAYAPAAGVVTTARDLLEFCAAQFHGDERLLTDASKREAQHGAWAVEGAPVRYGLGFDVAEVGGRTMRGHGGGFPGFVTFTAFDPDDALAITVLANCVDSGANPTVLGVLELLSAPGGKLSKAPKVDPDRARRFTGRFMGMWGTADIALLGDRLVGINPDLPSPLEGYTAYEIVDDETLRIADSAGFAAPGEQVSFTIGADGRATEMVRNHSVARPPEEYLAWAQRTLGG